MIRELGIYICIVSITACLVMLTCEISDMSDSLNDIALNMDIVTGN